MPTLEGGKKAGRSKSGPRKASPKREGANKGAKKGGGKKKGTKKKKSEAQPPLDSDKVLQALDLTIIYHCVVASGGVLLPSVERADWPRWCCRKALNDVGMPDDPRVYAMLERQAAGSAGEDDLGANAREAVAASSAGATPTAVIERFLPPACRAAIESRGLLDAMGQPTAEVGGQLLDWQAQSDWRMAKQGGGDGADAVAAQARLEVWNSGERGAVLCARAEAALADLEDEFADAQLNDLVEDDTSDTVTER
jgi:hypothetical protein